jgi:hypothetical protein
MESDRIKPVAFYFIGSKRATVLWQLQISRGMPSLLKKT